MGTVPREPRHCLEKAQDNVPLLCCVNLGDSPPLSEPPGPTCIRRVGAEDLVGWVGSGGNFQGLGPDTRAFQSGQRAVGFTKFSIPQAPEKVGW